MTRYRIICADGNDGEEDVSTDRASLEEVCGLLDRPSSPFPVDCGPHRVEKVPDDEGRVHLDTALMLNVQIILPYLTVTVTR